MDDRTKLTLFRGIKSGALNDKQKLEAFRAIKNDASNEDVSDLLTSMSFSSLQSGKSLQEMSNERQGRDLNNFDYKSGADGRLRSLMSFGETEEDREAILKRIVGEDGYVRDNGGRLALTPTGQKIRGMEPTDKNIIIEDEGFSMRDFSDLAGILPETVGSIAGAVIGGGPSFGLGAIAGAGIGGATGQAIEELLEKFLGVQTQDLGEVSRDVMTEFAIGAGGEILGAAIIGAGRRIVGGGKSLAGKAAGRGSAEELSEENVRLLQGLVDRNYIPSMEALGAQKFASYGQKFLENMGKISTRVDNNTKMALRDRDLFLQGLKESDAEDLGKMVTDLTPEKFAELERLRDSGQTKIFKAIDDSIKMLVRSTEEDLNLSPQMLSQITDAFAAFQKSTKDNFDGIDEILAKIKEPITDPNTGETILRTGDKIPLFNTQVLKVPLDEHISLQRNLADPAVIRAKEFLEGAPVDGATFKDLSILRKEINDSLFFRGEISTQGSIVLKETLEVLNDMLDTKVIASAINKETLSPKNKELLELAAKQRKKAMNAFREGQQRFEKLAQIRLVRSIRDLGGDGADVKQLSDNFINDVVSKNSPEKLEAVLKASDTPDELRDMLSRNYIRQALEKANFKEYSPDAFNGAAFEKAIKDLGTTGPKLFGKEWNKIKKLSNEIGLSTTKASNNTLLKANADKILNLNSDSAIGLGMKDLLDAQVNLNKASKTSILKKIKEGDYENFDAVVQALTAPNITQSEVIKIMKFFDNKPELKQKMKNVVLEDILSKVDDKVFKSSKNAGALKEVLSKYKRGTLKQILGKDTEAALQTFGDELVILGDVGTEGSIAAGTVWANIFKHPINTLTTIGRAKVIAGALSTPQAAKAVLAARRAAGNDPQAQAQAILSALNTSMVEQGMDIGGSASKAGKILSGGLRAASQGSRAVKQTLPRLAGLGSFEQAQNRTNVPNVQPGGFFPPPLPNVRRQTAPSALLSPIEQITRNAVAKTIRQRARENPAVAASLLGGLGSAGLL